MNVFCSWCNDPIKWAGIEYGVSHSICHRCCRTEFPSATVAMIEKLLEGPQIRGQLPRKFLKGENEPKLTVDKSDLDELVAVLWSAGDSAKVYAENTPINTSEYLLRNERAELIYKTASKFRAKYL